MFADLAQRTLDATFNRLGEPANYTPLKGTPEPIKVIPAAADELLGSLGGQQVKTESAVFEIRVSEVASVSRGDQIEWKGTKFVVNGPARRLDSARLVWTVGAAETA